MMMPTGPFSVARRSSSRMGRPLGGRGRRTGFTLVELLVVIFIILLVSAVALPTVLPALNNRQISEAGRMLQGALVGARDKAIHDGQPSGIRLLPDPDLFSVQSTGLVDPTQPLAYNRIVPIGPAPEYTEGFCTTVPQPAYFPNSQTNYVLTQQVRITTFVPAYPLALMIVQSPIDTTTGLANPPTSWYWNIRVGDKVQLNNAGPWYTVVGPMTIGPGGTTINGTLYANPEGFVNIGAPGPLTGTSPVPKLTTTVHGTITHNSPVEYLLLVNGIDDNRNGWIDEGWDGVDNDGDGLVDEATCKLNPQFGEWIEAEQWIGQYGTRPEANVAYTIRRRPAPLPGSREISLPTSIVIDATTWSNANKERSRLPVNQFNGLVEIMVNPDGTVFYNSPYGAPSSFGMDQAFYHFWLAERQDVATPVTPTKSGWPYLPVPTGMAAAAGISAPGDLKGNYSILTLSARTGQIAVNENPPFLYSSTAGYNSQAGTYNASNPFIPAEQGVRGGP